jgi:hypothetical protein
VFLTLQLFGVVHATSLPYSFTTNGTVVSETVYGTSYVTVKIEAPKNNVSVSNFAFGSGPYTSCLMLNVYSGGVYTNVGYARFYSNITAWVVSDSPSVYLNSVNNTVYVKALHHSEVEITFYKHYEGEVNTDMGPGALLLIALQPYINNLGVTLFFSIIYMTSVSGIYIKTKKVSIAAAAGVIGLGFYGALISGFAVEAVMLMIVFALAGSIVLLYRRNQW